MSVDSKLLSVAKKKGVYLIVSKDGKYQEVNRKILTIFLKKLKKKGVYVTFNKEAEAIEKELKGLGIDTSKLLFIDGISMGRNAMLKNKDNIIYLQGPTSLTELSLAVTSATNNGGFDFILMDSLSTLAMYNKPDMAERFFHYLITKIKDYELNTVILSVDDAGSKNLVSIIGQFCDGVVRL